jgi:probable HAF family extracellular repeat protein
LLWEKDGSVHDLGNLGGTGGIAGNHACAINNQGQVVGHSELTGNATFYGFLWTSKTGMQPIYPLQGDYASLGLDINDGGVVVGASLDADFNPRAFVVHNGAPVDLNTVASGDAGLYLLFAFAINSSGEIVGLAVDPATGELHGYLASPNSGEANDHSNSASERVNRPTVLSDDARKLVLRRMGIRGR